MCLWSLCLEQEDKAASPSASLRRNLWNPLLGLDPALGTRDATGSRSGMGHLREGLQAWLGKGTQHQTEPVANSCERPCPGVVEGPGVLRSRVTWTERSVPCFREASQAAAWEVNWSG